MGPTRRPSFLLAVCGAAACGALLLAAPRPAPAADDEERKPRTRKVETVTEKTHKHLNEAHEYIEAEKYGEAKKKLDYLAGLDKLNSYERALIHQMYAYVYSSLEDYAKACREFEMCLATGGLPEASARSTLYNLAQLYLVTEQIDKSISTLERWFADAENPSSEAYILLASAYGQKQEYRKAIPHIRTAISKSTDPKESWFQLLLGMHFELNELRECVGVLHQLVSRWPAEEDYWKQLAGMYRELNEEDKALAITEIAFRQGFLNESKELVTLAQLYLYRDVPYKAARVLSQGLSDGRIERTSENYELEANAWYQAQEIKRSLDPLRRAARLSNDGDLYVRLAQFHIEAEEYEQAVDALEAAIGKSGLRNPGRAHLLLGISRFHIGRIDSARSSFARASEHEDTKRQAQQWLRHLRQHARAS